ncbi:unnamed protein product [Adineta steineri]|uniref:PKS/mFAS DH domain-containing protein n=1 Tax=Adineta steineri TaxID=433720 RepID=A0A815J3D4_9BILA|nr:unnamed protein product [Adineta steineri]
MLLSLKKIRGYSIKDQKQIFNPIYAQTKLYSSVTDDNIPVDNEATNVFLEISPYPVLATSIQDEQITLLTSLAQLTTSSQVWQQYFKTRQILPTKNHEEYFDNFPLYKFHLSSCWYESKDSSIQRLANRIPAHPLLGIRQLNEQTNATWKSLININLPQHAFLKDHKIQDAILFPAVVYLELATAACQQLLSLKEDNQQQQPTIIFEDINFTKALILNEHELIEVFTQVIMPMREWYIYSRPWSTAGPDCMRPSGMTCTDVVESFRDQDNLNKYSLNEFTLHARGKIEIDFKEQKSLTIPPLNTINDTWSTQDIASAYAHLSTRGYQYGSSFQKNKNITCPRLVTIRVDEKTIDEIQQILSISYPNIFKAYIRRFPIQDQNQIFNPICAKAKLYSSVIGEQVNDNMPVDAHYWWSNVRQAVRFYDAIAAIIKDEAANVFLEISPHPVLATSIRECYELTNQQQSSSPLIRPTLKRKENKQITLLTSLAQLTTSSQVWQQYFHTRQILPMKNHEEYFDNFPLYKFHLSSCWYESKDSSIQRLANRISTHPLLGIRQFNDQTNATWKNHKSQDAILFPAVAYLELATAACQQLLS